MPEFREHISCRELVELTSDYIENALSAEDAELMEQHLNYCAGCERYVDEMLRTIRAEGRLREEGVPGETLTPIITAFRERRRS
ncbi:MAG TPA: zf-HC2 domain-containing protein [Solirubrobacterales bacterium]|nr:zf-HC2 domain-containing protein [Solirubrobacterales bacterium]